MERLLLRVSEAAELTGLGRSKAYEMVQTGRWPAVRIDGCLRVSYEWLKGWVERQAAEAVAEIADLEMRYGGGE